MMKFSFAATTFLGVVAVIGTVHADEPPACLTSTADLSVDIFTDKVEPLFSQGWNVTYHNTYKIANNLFDNTTYLLYQCGSTPPADVVDNGNFNAVLEIPLSNVGLSQTPHIGFMEQLELVDEIAAFLTDTDFISSPCFLDEIAAGNVLTLVEPSEGVDAPATGNTALSAGTVAFVASFTQVPFDNTVNIQEYSELTNVAVFEWVKFFSLFFNKEHTANQVVEAAESRFDCVAQNAGAVQADNMPVKPVVLWAYYSDFCGGWDVAECPNYYCEFANACGAEIISSTEGNTTVCGAPYMTTEELVELGKDADHWIYPSNNWDTASETFGEQLQNMKAVQDQQVFDYQASGENAWFEQRYAEYYNVLADFCAVVGTTQPLTSRSWFRNVFTEPVGSLPDCSPTQSANILDDVHICFLPTTGGAAAGGGSGSGGSSAKAIAVGTAALAAGLLSLIHVLLF
jgi:iron complex transport system substrate-binding protein